MATIKERAAALNLAEKLCVRPHAPGVATKSAQSSSIWSSLIFHLRSTVTVKRRLVHLKSHDNCFLGSEAVDVVADHITHAKECEGAVVSREKVVHVCQALLECNVFEAVGTKVFGKNKKQGVFQDSKSALYRFVAVCTPLVDELERGVLASGIQAYFCCASPNRLEKQTCPVKMAPPVKVCETSVLAGQLETRLSTNLSLEPLSGSLSPSKALTDSVLPQSLVHQVWQEQTLHRLLNLVELPLLEEVLQCIQNPTSPPPANTVVHGNPDLIYSSNHLDRQILKAFRNSQEDEWLCAALDCLDFLPDQPVVELSRELPHCFPQEKTSDQELAGGSIQEEAHNGEQQTHLSQSGLAQCKLLLYGTLVKHYSHTNRSPLLPQHMTDIYMAITDLLVNAKLDRALEATQLCLKLLPLSSREELRGLLTFMSLAADPQGIKVDKEMENKLAVKKSFSRVILHSRAFTREKEDLMLVFMLSNIKEIFKIPGALHKGVSDKLASLAQGKQPDVTGATLSQQVCSRTCAESVKKTTNQELWILLNSIHLDTKMSAKERKRRLRLFNQAHPQVFNEYFGDSAISEL